MLGINWDIRDTIGINRDIRDTRYKQGYKRY